LKWIIDLIVAFHAALPLNISRLLGRCYGRFLYWSNSRIRKTTEINLRHCLPELTVQHRRSLTKESCLSTGMTITDSFWVWRRSITSINQRLTVSGSELISKHLASGNGVILTGAHVGCWELMTLWAPQHFPFIALFRDAKVSEMNELLVKYRGKSGANMYSASAKNIKRVLKALKQNQVFAILSDQQPDPGSGVFAPFFGQPAYTMTLPHQLAKRCGSQILFFDILRTKTGWHLSISQGSKLDETANKEAFATQLNVNLEALIRKDLAQFEWGYKRFKSPPDGDYDFYTES